MKDNYVIAGLGVLLLASFLGNVYLWNTREAGSAPMQNVYATSSSAILESPYGYRSQVVTVYDDGEVKTYSTTTPITEKEVDQMRLEVRERIEAMDEYFRQQEELFDRFWRSF